MTDYQLHAQTACSGVSYVIDQLHLALYGTHSYTGDASGRGPFQISIMHLARIASGEEQIEDEQAVREMIYACYPVIYHLRGGFGDSALKVVQAVHLKVADLVLREKAVKHDVMLDIAVDLKKVHVLYLNTDNREAEDWMVGYLDRHEIAHWRGQDAKHTATKARLLAEAKEKEQQS